MQALYQRKNRKLQLITTLILWMLFTGISVYSADGIYRGSGNVASPSIAVTSPFTNHEEKNTISLAGIWNFALDPDTVGLEEKWFTRQFDDNLMLPGTTDENKKGIFKDEQCDDRLSRVYYWKGAVWYQRRVSIPENWADKHIVLYLERTKDVNVWVDETYCGHGNSLSTPQVYDLSDAIMPGSHMLTILVDNDKVPPVGPAHAIDERTQTNWNGIIGKIELRATDPLWMEDIRVYPDQKNNRLRLEVLMGNDTKWGGNADLILQARSWNTLDEKTYRKMIYPVVVEGARTWVRFNYDFGTQEMPLWDEFDPALISMEVTLETQPGKKWLRNTRTVNFGIRDFKGGKAGFSINGKTTFLRGKNDCCIFPLTGYPPMDKEGWTRVFTIAKSYGINHYRFHSWCPPEAAFEAADETGMYLQPELPNKRDFGKPEHDDYLRREGEMIFQAYGNHPSFVMFTLGNELGRNEAYYRMVSHFQKADPRHLYAQGSNNMHWDPSLAEGDNFWVTNKTAKDLPVRGAFFQGDFAKPHIEHSPPSTMVDFSASIMGVPVPVVGHEIGAFQVSPDYSEIPKYTGVLRARNLEIFQDRLESKHMLDQAADFVRASGALSVICYREDIETALRTPGFGGFQLLDLQDFPGQGTALVGILNAFMESKGLITPDKWREFCAETVPLLRMHKYTWTNEETFCGHIQVAHYGPTDIMEGKVSWRLLDSSGEILSSGVFNSLDIQQGRLSEIGMIAVELKDIPAPQQLSMEIEIPGTIYRNRYSIWLYPSRIDTYTPDGLMMVTELEDDAISHLKNGGKVLLLPDLDKLKKSVMGSFQTDYWCYPMFRRAAEKQGIEPAPGTLGILCDPEMPALVDFPTEFHSNWQWWHLVKNSRPLILDDTPPGYRPIVQVIDNFERNHKLGLLFEAKVGEGKLLVCTIDLLGNQDKPEARQLLHSLQNYAVSSKFAPGSELSIELLKSILTSE